MGALAQAVDSIRRSTVKVSFEAFNVSMMVSRRLQNSELQLYNVERNENRQLQSISPSVEECLINYENVKIVKVVQEITVRLPMNMDAAHYSILLLNLSSDQNYFQNLRSFAAGYGLAMSYNITTTMCGSTSFDQCDTLAPSALPSFNPSSLPTALPSIIPSIASADAATFLPSTLPTDYLSVVPSLIPSFSPTNATHMLSINFTQVTSIFFILFCHHFFIFPSYLLFMLSFILVLTLETFVQINQFIEVYLWVL
jgi:hypothetical protein